MNDEIEYHEASVALKADRRNFLSAALATMTVAAVTGGTAALLLDKDDPPNIVANDSPPAPQRSARPATELDVNDLRAQLTTLEAENSSLSNKLSAAQQQLESYRQTDIKIETGEDWRRQFEQADAQATVLAGRLAAVQGLLAIYEALETTDLAEAAASGVEAVGGVLGELVADIPYIDEGLSSARKALDEFEEQLPLIEQGRYWLEGQLTIVNAALEAAEVALNNVLKAGGTFMQLLNRWFEDILKWLPFGIGQGALNIMSTIGDLLAQVPETIDGLRLNVAGPLDVWLERDGDENRLQRRLIKPVRQEALDRADSTLMRLGSVNEVYKSQLREPVSILVERRRAIREQIAQYRQDHAL